MLNKILERSGTLEVFLRKTVTAFAPLKKRIKHILKNKAKTESPQIENIDQIKKFKESLSGCGIKSGDIVIVHSSFDGLKNLGLSAEKIIDLIFEVFPDSTLAFAAYPIESGKKKGLYKYDPKNTICWTGVLPNIFLKKEGVIRSEFPYNSLSAAGKEAEAMMKDNLKSLRPHDMYSAWEFCRQRHAKILFLGTSSREANTMAIHMVPDIMGEKWPVERWYTQRKYLIKTDKGCIEKTIEIQDGFWYRYVNEYKTDKALKDSGLLRDISINNTMIEIIDDSFKMMDFLTDRCGNGDLMYKIPKKFYKK